jgi:peptidoglycan/LPS O-acetylase OafA/YrhL
VKVPHFRYRPDIDGLRAVAIIPVVLFHAGIEPFQGGYVGVDVFFVISGYLITSLILSEMEIGVFTVARFYERRIRRIFPALFVMMAFAMVIGWWIFAPEDYKLLGQSIFATTLFASNILFWRHSGYFDVPASELPLLHTWSLAVEEQFYAVFPLYLSLIRRSVSRWPVHITLAICATSFLVNVLSIRAHPHAAFFLASHRVWELLIGALLAMGALPALRASLSRTLVSISGLALILIAIFTFSSSTIFPGTAALLPVLGTAAIIWTGASGSSTVTTLLSGRVLVFIGKISYSLYLWHFPLLAFAGYVSINGLTLAQRWTLIAVSFCLAVLSWMIVEQPIRRGRWMFGKQRVVFASGALAICAMGAVALATYRAQGFPGRLDVAELRILDASTDFDQDREHCSANNAADITEGRLCKIGNRKAVKPQFILWGDSHAETLRPAIDAVALKHQSTGLFAGRGGCAPVVDVDRADEPECLTVNQAVLDLILSERSISTVILAARWGLWAEGTRYKRENRGGAVVLSVAQKTEPAPHNVSALGAGLDRTIAALTAAEKTVWLVGPIPEVGYPVPRALYLARLGQLQHSHIQPSAEELQERQKHVFALFGALAQKYPVKIVWPHKVLCDSTACKVERGNVPLYSDDNHLTRTAALSLSPLFDDFFEGR